MGNFHISAYTFQVLLVGIFCLICLCTVIPSVIYTRRKNIQDKKKVVAPVAKPAPLIAEEKSSNQPQGEPDGSKTVFDPLPTTQGGLEQLFPTPGTSTRTTGAPSAKPRNIKGDSPHILVGGQRINL